MVAEDEGTSVIIDGQQRLATTTILLAALRDAYAARGDDSRADGIHNKYIARFDIESATDVPRLELNAEDQEFFDSVIIEGVSEAAEIESHQRLIKAQKYFSNVLEEDLGAAGTDWNRRIVEWIAFLDSNVKVMVIQVPDIADAFVIFETLNDRGAPLTISDLLRNYLMSKGRDTKGLKAIQDAWGQVLLNLGLQKEDNIFVDFLRQFWSSKHGAVREKELFSSIRKHVKTKTQTVTLAKELPDASRHYAALLDSKHELWSEFGPEAQASIEGRTSIR